MRRLSKSWGPSSTQDADKADAFRVRDFIEAELIDTKLMVQDVYSEREVFRVRLHARAPSGSDRTPEDARTVVAPPDAP